MKYLFTFVVTFAAVHLLAQSHDKLWFDTPAQYFEEAMVLGNGKLGASVFGGVIEEKIYLNDITLWSGEPVNPNMNPEAYKHVPEIREALANENYELADQLNRKLQGSFSQSYAPLGTLLLKMDHDTANSEYYRELNIATATGMVSYEVGDVTYTREYLVSHPDQIIAIRLTSNRPRALAFTLGFESLLKFETTTANPQLEAHGYAPYHAEPNYRGKMPNAIRFEKNRGTRFTSIFDIRQTDGTITSTDSSLIVKNASEAVIYISMATSFNGFDKDPAKMGLDDGQLAQQSLKKAQQKSFQEIKERHIEDYQQFFSRVHLDLGASNAPNLPVDERLKRYAQGEEDKNLEILYFQYGRYLLISSSRTPEVPANLQGLWNQYIRPPWSSNYTININAEENYWPAEIGNLSELHHPLLSFIGNVAETGKTTAKTFYGVNGWVACHNTDIWAMSNPVGDFGKGDPVWANWNMGGAWLVTHLWEHYQFTRDTAFLRDYGYDLMKGAAQFCLEWLVEDKQGNLVTSPSTSPENVYITPSGYKGATLYGATADLAIIRECFDQTIKASETLNLDSEFRMKLENALNRLYPYQIGKKGNLQEWYHDWEDADPKHRHQSHLYGLYPGHHITPYNTPDLANACRTTLEIKGDETTGWSKGWRINLWARLWDGNRAYKMYRELLRFVDPSGKDIQYSGGGGTYPNLLDAHPPFQIDGNFGGSAAVMEMLLQSTEDQIFLLPALPDAWSIGQVSGLCARGGFEVSMEWNENKLVRATVTARKKGSTTIIYGDQKKLITLDKGEIIDYFPGG